MKKILFLTAVLFCWCGTASERQISGAEMLEMRLESSEMLTLPEENWRFIYADREEFASPDLDDSRWATVRINAPLSGKNKPDNMPDDYKRTKSSCWYRCTFELPENVQANNFELRLGQISRGDQTYINGHLIGSFSFDKIVNLSKTARGAVFMC